MEELIREIEELIGLFGVAYVMYSLGGEHVKIRLEVTQTVCDRAIDDMDLSNRSNNALKRAGVKTVGDLVDFLNAGKIASTRNLGAKSIREIKEKTLNYCFDNMSRKRQDAWIRGMLQSSGK